MSHKPVNVEIVVASIIVVIIFLMIFIRDHLILMWQTYFRPGSEIAQVAISILAFFRGRTMCSFTIHVTVSMLNSTKFGGKFVKSNLFCVFVDALNLLISLLEIGIESKTFRKCQTLMFLRLFCTILQLWLIDLESIVFRLNFVTIAAFFKINNVK